MRSTGSPVRVAILSPHLDDAALCLGGTLYRISQCVGPMPTFIDIFSRSRYVRPEFRAHLGHQDISELRNNEESLVASHLGCPIIDLLLPDSSMRGISDEEETLIHPEDEAIRPALLSLGAPLKEACSEANKKLAIKDCADRKYTPQPINCLGAAWTPNQEEGNATPRTLECPEAGSDSVGFDTDFQCQSINSISCPPKPTNFSFEVKGNGKKVTRNCQSPEREGPFCEQGANKGAGCFYEQMQQSETIDLNGADAKQACQQLCGGILQKSKKERIECPGVEV